jgi:hypothetical protein
MAKRRKRRTKKVARKKRRTKRRARAYGSAGLIKQLTVHRNALVAQQAGLQGEIDGIGAAIEALGGRASARPATRGRPRGRPRGRRGLRKGSLKSYILRVLKPRGEMAVKDIARGVKRAGYKTTSKNFANQVSNALAQMDELTKMGRGRYRS